MGKLIKENMVKEIKVYAVYDTKNCRNNENYF